MASRSAADMSRGTRPSGIGNTKLYVLVRNGLRVPVEVESQEREIIDGWSQGVSRIVAEQSETHKGNETAMRRMWRRRRCLYETGNKMLQGT